MNSNLIKFFYSTAKVRTIKPKFKPKNVIEITPRATTRIQEIIKNQNDPNIKGLRLSLKTRGCNGLSFDMNYVKEPIKTDEKVEIDQNIIIYIDSKALLSIIGTEMDYIETFLSSEFVFNNPNAKSTCGCGESFNL